MPVTSIEISHTNAFRPRFVSLIIWSNLAVRPPGSSFFGRLRTHQLRNQW